nr:YihY/virulence factor BrkB family protein [Rhabdobacter roseus]
MRLAGATAFFTTFALPAILLIFIQLFGLFINPDQLSAQLLQDLKAIVGEEGADQLQFTIENLKKLSLDQEWYFALIGFGFLLIVATTLFHIVQSSLDEIWKIKVQARPGLKFRLKLRARSLGIILLAGVLFLVGLLLEGLKIALGGYLILLFPTYSALVRDLFHELFFIVMVTVWFSILFRFLTSARPKWKLALQGGFFTGILFTGGKLLLRWLLSLSNVATMYGAAGSIVLILLFVFYSSFIFYYGGSFIKVLSDTYDKPIRPLKKAFTYEVQEREVKPGKETPGQST